MSNSNSQTVHSRKKRADGATAYNRRLIAAGHVRLTTILPPHTAKKLDALQRIWGTRKATLIAIIEQANTERSGYDQ